MLYTCTVQFIVGKQNLKRLTLSFFIHYNLYHYKKKLKSLLQKVSDDDTKEISNSYESAMVCITSHCNQRTPFNGVFMYTTTKEQFINQNYMYRSHTQIIFYSTRWFVHDTSLL